MPGALRSLGVLLAASLLAVVPASAEEAPAAEPEQGTPGIEEGSDEPGLEGDQEIREGQVAPGASRGPTAGIEEIVITGVPLEDAHLDDATSATTFNAEEIKGLRIQRISDLADYTANLEINTAFAASNPTLFIRGIGLKDYNANAAGAVGVYQDGININSPAIQLGQIFDIRNIEVLRGPQGSLNGRNSTAGAILLFSAEPEPEFGFQSSFTYGNYNTIQADGAVNVPIWGEALTSRVAFTANFADGNTRNRCSKWNPEKYGFARVDPETIEETYNRLLPSDQPVDIFLRNGNRRDTRFVYLNTEESLAQNQLGNVAAIHRLAEDLTIDDPNNPGQQLTLPAGTRVGQMDNFFTLLNTDGICVVEEPGRMVTAARSSSTGEAVGFLRNRAPALEDFQGLKTWVNDVDNWAGRGVLRFEPGAEGLIPPALRGLRLEGMDWLLNYHGGQNRGDSRHLQMLGANVLVDGTIFEFTEAGFSEAQVGRSGLGFEGVKKQPGLAPNPSIPGLLGERGSDPFVGYYNQDGKELIDTHGFSLRGHWDLGSFGDFGSIVITSLTGREWYERKVEDEGDANPQAIFPAIWSDNATQWSQELRIEGEGDGWSWIAGFFYLSEDLDSFNVFPDTRNFELTQKFKQELTSWGPYAGGRYEFTEELSFEGGVRYSHESKDFELQSAATSTGSETTAILIDPEVQSRTWTAVTGDATLLYRPVWDWLTAIRNDDTNFYAKYARGFKGGHFNAGLLLTGSGVSQSADPVKPEYVHSIELGWKSSWFDERVTLQTAVFRYWYDNLQVFDIANGEGELPFQKLLNGDARVWGAEGDFSVRPTEALFIQGSAGWLDSEFVDFTVTKSILNQRGEPDKQEFDYAGNPLIAAPVFNISGVVEYTLPLWDYGFLVPQFDFSFRTRTYLDPQAIKVISQPAYWLLGARLAWRTQDEKIEVALWGENLLDEHYLVDAFDVTREFDTILQVWGDPRTYGITLSYRW